MIVYSNIPTVTDGGQQEAIVNDDLSGLLVFRVSARSKEEFRI